jgi:hypothetical protein
MKETMTKDLKSNGTNEVPWDEFTQRHGLSAGTDNVTKPTGDEDEDPASVRKNEGKAAAVNKLSILHGEICGFYGDIVPVGKDCKALRKLNSVERYVIRNAEKWEPLEMLTAHEIARHASGVWMSTIARALAKMEKKRE